MRDPNPLVSGRGNKLLRERGIEVVVGVGEQESRELNEAYLHFMDTGLPFIIIKVAQTLDGFTALPTGESQWITGELARERVHRLRAASDAVMVGRRTALKDDPSLNVRYGIESHTIRRIVLDETLDLPPSLKLFSDTSADQTIVATSEGLLESDRAAELRDSGIRVIGAPIVTGGLRLADIFTQLGEMNIASVLVEGGATLHSGLLATGLVQKVLFFIAPKLIGHGLKVFTGLTVDNLDDAYRFDIHRMEMVGEDALLTAYWHKG
jgi:diaminohydroxyphosphoribosylaminopyrimidine deaminase/5-amino-6-(5-phosphoribosylamino)uracil reductase